MKANLFDKVFAHYQTVCSQTSTYKKTCSKKDLAYQQWIDKSVFEFPASYVPATSDSYVNTFRPYSGLPGPIELGDYLQKAEVTPFAVTLMQAH